MRTKEGILGILFFFMLRMGNLLFTLRSFIRVSFKHGWEMQWVGWEYMDWRYSFLSTGFSLWMLEPVNEKCFIIVNPIVE